MGGETGLSLLLLLSGEEREEGGVIGGETGLSLLLSFARNSIFSLSNLFIS